MGYYLAIEIDEDVGNLFLGHLEEGKLKVENIYHFEKDKEIKTWKVKTVFQEIITGMKKCREISKLPVLVGIHSWQNYLILLNEEDQVIEDMLIYDKDCDFIEQLTIWKDHHLEQLNHVKTIFMLPDYLNFLLTGIKLSEYTSAMTTKLIKQLTQAWDEEEIQKLGFSKEIFQEIKRPGAVLGNLTRNVTEEVGYDCVIVLPATHAESSAYFALSKAEEKYKENSLKSISFAPTSESEEKYSAAVIGNLLVQMIISHEIKDVKAAHECLEKSFVITQSLPVI